MNTRTIKTGYILTAFTLVFCIYSFTALDAFDFLSKKLPFDEIATKADQKAATLYNLSITLLIMAAAAANIFYWRHGKQVFFWLTALFIVIAFTGIAHLHENILAFKNYGKVQRGSMNIFYSVGAVQIILFNGALLVNYFIAKALRDKKIKKHPRNTMAVVN